MRKSNWKFFVIIGVLLTLVGGIVFPDDGLIGMIGVIIGVSNIVKGLRLYRGIQPLVMRKQEERERAVKDEVQEKIKHANKNRNK